MGFGSFYYADFILFHKYLNINKMTSLEYNKEVEKRCKFNKPYKFVELLCIDSTTYLENLSNWDEKLFVWLDYNGSLEGNTIKDVELVAAKAKLFDIFIVTLNASPPPTKGIDGFCESYGDYIPTTIHKRDFTMKRFSKVLHGVLSAGISNGLTRRQDSTKFLQLFSLSYQDSSKMYTFGGIFCPESRTGEIKRNIGNSSYVSHDENIVEINCPIVTPKEKMYLDAFIRKIGRIDKNQKTGLSDELINSYAMYYKYYPQFFESVF